MDYSLLLGTATIPRYIDKAAASTSATGAGGGGGSSAGVGSSDPTQDLMRETVNTEWNRDGGGLRARGEQEEESDTVYFLGIIDILQEFNMKKRLENAYKTRLQVMAGKDPTLISAVDATVGICITELASSFDENIS